MLEEPKKIKRILMECHAWVCFVEEKQDSSRTEISVLNIKMQMSVNTNDMK